MSTEVVKEIAKNAFGGARAKIASKKFYAYLVGNIVLLTLVFTSHVKGDEIVGFLKVLNIGYWATEGGLDAARLMQRFFENRNGEK